MCTIPIWKLKHTVGGCIEEISDFVLEDIPSFPICAKPNNVKAQLPALLSWPGARRRGVPPPNSLALHLAFSLALLHPSLTLLLAPLHSSCKRLH